MAQMSANLKAQTAEIKLLKGTATRRPPNNPDMPQNIIDNLNTDFNTILELLDSFRKAIYAKNRIRPLFPKFERFLPKVDMGRAERLIPSSSADAKIADRAMTKRKIKNFFIKYPFVRIRPL